MSSFQAKIGWKRQRKRENKNYRFVPFLTRLFKENSKTISKKFKIRLWDHFKPKQVGED